jgi:large conductance mechanosensitive channel
MSQPERNKDGLNRSYARSLINKKGVCMLNGFKQFILRGNVVDLAVGVVIGAAFSSVVDVLVKGMLTPLIGVIAKVPDFSGLKFSVSGSDFLIGSLINSILSFILVAAAVYFFVVTPVNALIARSRKEAPSDPTTKKCGECQSEVSILAKRCAFCTELL